MTEPREHVIHQLRALLDWPIECDDEVAPITGDCIVGVRPIDQLRQINAGHAFAISRRKIERIVELLEKTQ